MKKITTVVTLFSLLATIYSCDPDDSVETVTDTEANNKIAGVWYPKDAVVEGVVFPYDDHEECGKDYIEFGPNGFYREVDVWNCEEVVDITATYTIEGNQLNLKVAGETARAEILELKEESLVLLIVVDHDADDDMEEVQARFTRE